MREIKVSQMRALQDWADGDRDAHPNPSGFSGTIAVRLVMPIIFSDSLYWSPNSQSAMILGSVPSLQKLIKIRICGLFSNLQGRVYFAKEEAVKG